MVETGDKSGRVWLGGRTLLDAEPVAQEVRGDGEAEPVADLREERIVDLVEGAPTADPIGVHDPERAVADDDGEADAPFLPRGDIEHLQTRGHLSYVAVAGDVEGDRVGGEARHCEPHVAGVLVVDPAQEGHEMRGEQLGQAPEVVPGSLRFETGDSDPVGLGGEVGVGSHRHGKVLHPSTGLE